MDGLTAHTQRLEPGIIVPSVCEILLQENTNSYLKCVARDSLNGVVCGVEITRWCSRSVGLEAIPGFTEAATFLFMIIQ